MEDPKRDKRDNDDEERGTPGAEGGCGRTGSALTELGRELLPAVDAIVDVGHRLKQRRSNSSN